MHLGFPTLVPEIELRYNGPGFMNDFRVHKNNDKIKIIINLFIM